MAEYTPSRKQFMLLSEYIDKNYNKADKLLDLGDLNTRIPTLKGNFGDLTFVKLIFSAVGQKAKDVCF